MNTEMEENALPVTPQDLAIAVEGKKEENTDHLDKHGRIISEEYINFKMTHEDLLFVDETIKKIIDLDLVPVTEAGPVVTLLEMLAEREKSVYHDGHILLPVNYFTGMWHCLQTGRKFSIYSQQWKKKDKYLDRITMEIAKSIDAYHAVKSHVKNEAKADKVAEGYFGKSVESAPKIDVYDKGSEVKK